MDDNIGMWNEFGDVDPIKDLKNLNFKDYDGYSWDIYVSIKKEDTLKLGLINKDDYFRYTKSIIPKLIVDNKMDLLNTKWYACLHIDSKKNMNFHVYLLELKPTKTKYIDRLFSKSAIKRFKSNALNYLINMDELFILKEKLFLNVIDKSKYENINMLNRNDKIKSSIQKDLMKLFKKLPNKYCSYNSELFKNYKPELDLIINKILTQDDVFSVYSDYLKNLKTIDDKYKEYYGEAKENNYFENQKHKLFTHIGNDILKNYYQIISNNILENEKEFLSKYLLKFNFQVNNITNSDLIKLSSNLYKISVLANLNEFQRRSLFKKIYNQTNKETTFNDYYINVKANIDNKDLTLSSFFTTLNNLGINKNKYYNIKTNYLSKVYIRNILLQSAYNHIKYENERIENEIIYELDNI